MDLLIQLDQEVPGLLGHPLAGRVRVDPGQVDPTPVDLDV
jgi:hypothetical protein